MLVLILQYFQSFVNTQQQMRSAPPPAVPWSTVPALIFRCLNCLYKRRSDLLTGHDHRHPGRIGKHRLAGDTPHCLLVWQRLPGGHLPALQVPGRQGQRRHRPVARRQGTINLRQGTDQQMKSGGGVPHRCHTDHMDTVAHLPARSHAPAAGVPRRCRLCCNAGWKY